MEWFVSVSKSKVRSLSVSSNCYDKQHIIKPWLAKQNNFKYFAVYSQQLYTAGAASEWSTWDSEHLVEPLACSLFSRKPTLSPLMEVTSWHLPNDFLLYFSQVEHMRCTSIFATPKTAGSFSQCKYIQMWPLIAAEDVIFLLVWCVLPLTICLPQNLICGKGTCVLTVTTNLKTRPKKPSFL